MKRTMMWVPIALSLAAFLLVSLGCKSNQHQVTSGRTDYPMACQLCYDEARRVLSYHRGGPRAGGYKTIKMHQCPDCRSEVTTYMQDGQPMIRCPRCAPEGVACDRCLPPKSNTPDEL